MRPNIFFLVIDSLRADRCHGQKRSSKTPNIDNLLKNGVYFEQAISSIPSTGAAVSTIFTGLYPFKTGMSGGYQKLDPKINTYVKILKKYGYHNYATSPELASILGLTCDFENEDKSYQNYFGLFAGLGNQIVEKLESKSFKEPWFFYVHFVELHGPVIVPKKFDKEEFGKTQYDRMICAIDHWIGNIIKHIDQTKTLIVLTSDHGDYVPLVVDKEGNYIDFQTSKMEKSLWKMGNRIPTSLYPLKRKASSLLHATRYIAKKSKIENENLTPYQKRVLTNSRMTSNHHVYDDLIRIPLIFSGFTIKPKANIKQQVRSVDIFPTIFELIGLEKKENIDGQSLVALINGEELVELPTYIESMPTIKKKTEQKIGIRTSNYKYIRNSDENKQNVELYDLKEDPLEENNIAKNNSDLVAQMEKILVDIRKTDKIKPQKTSDDEKKIIEDELRKLGYV